jgi:hypothetical protein
MDRAPDPSRRGVNNTTSTTLVPFLHHRTGRPARLASLSCPSRSLRRPITPASPLNLLHLKRALPHIPMPSTPTSPGHQRLRRSSPSHPNLPHPNCIVSLRRQQHSSEPPCPKLQQDPCDAYICPKKLPYCELPCPHLLGIVIHF